MMKEGYSKKELLNELKLDRKDVKEDLKLNEKDLYLNEQNALISFDTKKPYYLSRLAINENEEFIKENWPKILQMKPELSH